MKHINTIESSSQSQAEIQAQENENSQNPLADDGDHRCPECGASEEFQRGVDERVVWMGLGETENCRCGADYVHRHQICKTPLHEESLERLLSLAREVEFVYSNLTFSMSEEQISLNREYFGRIANAIAEANHRHIFDRYSASIKKRQYDEAFEKLLGLIAAVSGGGTARAFIKYFDFPSELVEIEEMIADYQRKLNDR